MQLISYSHATKTHFHKNSALSLVLKMGVFGARKWPILARYRLGYSFFIYKNVVFPVQAQHSHFSADFRLKMFFLYYS